MKSTLILLLFAAASCGAATVAALSYLSLPAGVTIAATAADSAGNVSLSGKLLAQSSAQTTLGPMSSGVILAVDAGRERLRRGGHRFGGFPHDGGGAGEKTTPAGIAVNAAGEVFLTGSTSGGNFPMTSALAPQGQNSEFLTRISSAADRVIYSVALGASAVAVDSQSNAYVVGVASAEQTNSGEGIFP